MTRRAVFASLTAAALVVTLVCNGLANALPLNGMGTGELSALYPNLFVPMGLTFSIWGLLYLGLISLCGYGLAQIRSPAPETVVERLGPWMALNLLANAAWIFAWHWQQVALSVAIMGLILGTLLVSYRRVCVKGRGAGALERWAVHVPVCAYLGWISVATIANITALAVDQGAPSFGMAPAAIAVAMVCVAAVLGIAMLRRYGDVAYALVIAWALLGILIKRVGAADPGSQPVAAAAGIALGVLGIATASTVRRRGRVAASG